MSNEWWQFGLTIIGSIGLGSIISSWITMRYQKNKILFETKLLKYSDMIQAYQNSLVNQDQTGRQHFVSQLKQVELLGSPKIISLCQKLFNSSNGDETRNELVKAMHEDLKKSN